MNLGDLHNKTIELLKNKQSGHLLLEHENTRDRITPSRQKGLKTANRYAAQGMGRSNPSEVNAAELTEENLAMIEKWLRNEGKGEDTVYNTLSSLRFERDLAMELGVKVWVAPKIGKPHRHAIYKWVDGCKSVKIAKTAYVADYTAYGLRYKDWPEPVKKEYEEGILPFFTDPLALRRSAKRPASPTYMRTWLNRAERGFGFLMMCGISLEELSFKSLANYDNMLKYRNWLYERRGNRHTMTTKGDLEQWRHLADSYYGDRDTGRLLTELIRKLTDFVPIKDKGELVLRVHADDLYTVAYALIGEAEHYEANVGRKYDRVNPMALVAHKWMEAGAWFLTTVTWLREGNVAMLTSKHLRKLSDGNWHVRFTAKEMKSKRDYSDYVIDLWKADEVMGLLDRVLNKVVEMRPHLVERFRDENPGQPDPTTFFLNFRGRPYRESTLRLFFNSASVRYLGPEKRLTFHDVRTIIPTWLAVREGVGILPTIQRRLDHARFQTTQNFYLKMERVFDSRLAKAQMEEREKQRKTQDRLAKVPDQVAGMLKRFEELLVERTSNSGLDEEMIRRMIQEAVQTGLETGLTAPPLNST